MNLLAMTKQTGLRYEEVGFALGAAGGLLIAFGNVLPLGRRSSSMLGGIAIAAGFVLAIIGVHYGRLG
jgi:hypothetical protein